MAPAPKNSKLQKSPPKNASKKPYPNLSSQSQVSLFSQDSQKRPPQTSVLVILAVNNGYFRNEFMMGDFAGIRYLLNRMGWTNSDHFWTTIDLAEYCTNSKHRDIKIRGVLDEKIMFSNFAAEHRDPRHLYELKDEAKLKSEFISYLSLRAKETQAGDTVNLIAITHGNPSSSLMWGSDVISVSEINIFLKWFSPQVQVNFITNACFGGKITKYFSPENDSKRFIVTAAGPDEFAHGNGQIGWMKGKSPSGRFRSEYFTDVIIKSLAKIRIDWKGPSFQQFQQDLLDDVQNLPSPSARRTPTFYSFPQDSDRVLEQILHLSYADYPPNPQKASRYLRQESNMAIIGRSSVQDVDEWGFGGLVADFFAREVSKTDIPYLNNTDGELHYDMRCSIDSSLPGGNGFSKPDIFQEILIRAKIQSVVFAVFMFLQNQGLVSMDGLAAPLELMNMVDEQIADITRALLCFDFMKQLDRGQIPTGLESSMKWRPMGNYIAPLIWLATMIIRGAIVDDLGRMFAHIVPFGEFGQVDWTEFRTLWPEGRVLIKDPKAGLVEPRGPGKCQSCCCWLPHNIGKVVNVFTVYRTFDSQFGPLESLFWNYFKLPRGKDIPPHLNPALYLQEHMMELEF